MPRPYAMKTIIAETLMLVGMAVAVGHMATNFWERFMLQTELTNMKTSLYTLKDAVNKIGNAYDNLYKELQVLASENQTKQDLGSVKLPKKASSKLEPDKISNKESSTLTKHDERMQSQAEVQAEAEMQARDLIDISTNFEKAVEDFIQQCKSQPVRNTSTLATDFYPFSSIELGIKRLDDIPKKLSNCIHRCYNCSVSDELFYPAL